MNIPLSFGQRRLWFLGRLDGPGAVYNVPFAFRLSGVVDVGALRLALGDVVSRHEVLRTVFFEVGGEPFQRVLDAGGVRVGLDVVRAGEGELPGLLEEAAGTVFDLEVDLPLRAWLFEVGPREHVLLLVVHHIAADGWSLGPLARDVSVAYGARCRGAAPVWPPLPVQYVDYALWQHELVGSDGAPGDAAVAAQVEYWRKALAGLPDVLNLPTDRVRPPVASHRGGRVSLQCDARVHAGLLELGREEQCTLFMVLHAAFSVLLLRLGAGEDIPIGSPVAGRTDEAMDDLVGFFVNTLVLRADLSGNPSFRELLRRVRSVDLEAYANQDVPFERLVEVLNPVRSRAWQPLFQVMLAEASHTGLQHLLYAARTPHPAGALAVRSVRRGPGARFGGDRRQLLRTRRALPACDASDQPNPHDAGRRSLRGHALRRTSGCHLRGADTRRAQGTSRTASHEQGNKVNIPLSFGQRRLWFLGRLDGPGAVYNVPFAFRLSGVVDVGALRLALGDVVSRHEVLRTVFFEVGGEPFQRVLDAGGVRVGLDVVRAGEGELPGLLEEAAGTVFDLEVDLPLRAWLFEVGPREHVLLLVVHHIAADGWSLGPLARDVSVAYGARCRGAAPVWPPLPVQYVDYALWQHELVGSDGAPGDAAVAAQVEYWRKALAGLPDVLNLPTDRVRPPVASHRGGRVSLQCDARVHAGLLELGREEQCTLFMVLHAAFSVLLLRLGAGEDIPIGSPVAGRTDEAMDDLVGFFVNTLVLRADLSGNPSFRELLRRVRSVDLEAYANQDVPFERLVEVLNPVRSRAWQPLFQVMLALQNNAKPRWTLGDLTATTEDLITNVSKFDLSLVLEEGLGLGSVPEGLEGWLGYAADLFDRESAERLVERFLIVLDAVVADPDAAVGDIDVLTPEERQRVLVDWNAAGSGEGEVSPVTIGALFEERVRLSPDAVAVSHGGEEVSYRELNARANRLARYLISLGAGPERVVALALPRSVDMVVAALAVLKAGAAYLPVDPGFPAERVRFMLDDTRPVLALTHRGTRRTVPQEAGIPTIVLDAQDTARALAGLDTADVTDKDRTHPLHHTNAAYVA
ncbi:hypothetical protein SAZ_42665 [Streptomyces noursei ZPM]|nr:hypothetical protein SAZ_00140 [Streptomyces noursei ZPM]AKA09323.1 hypothetical protein SAZ_42665 [Streptomyces noursei ZPM]